MSGEHLPNLFPALDRATESALRESIKRFGVISPVVKDQHDRILDGHHRSRIAREVGAEYDVRVIEVADDDEARAISETLNNDRRHMEPEQRREVVAALREQGHSLRAIAGAIGVDPKTVRNDMARAGGDWSPPAAVVGVDGKCYPARARRPDPVNAALRHPDAVELGTIDQKRAQGDEARAPTRAATAPQSIEQAAERLAASGDEAAQRALVASRRAWHIELLAEASALTARLGSNLDGLRDAIEHMRPAEREVWQHTPRIEQDVWNQVGEILHAKPTLRRVQ